MFGIDFYPTPIEVIHRMLSIDDVRGKNCLEPSAGNGNIVDYLKSCGAKSVKACEIDHNLRTILSKKCEVIADDFLTLQAEQVSHVNLIAMNPPFSKADTHIRHAWEIAPQGCQIVALCNYENFDTYGRASRELNIIVKEYGNLEDLGECFRNAERKTDVRVGLVTLYKPITDSSFNFDGFFFDDEDIEDSKTNGIMQRNEVKMLVEHYVRALKCFSKIQEEGERIRELMTAIGVYSPRVKVEFSSNENAMTLIDFGHMLQRVAWRKVFEITGMEKMITSNVREDINKFIENNSNIPFTVKNIHKMLELLYLSRLQIMNTSIERAIDTFTKYTAENRYGHEGWKTNDGHMLNKKFIANYGVRASDYKQTLELEYGRLPENIADLEKAICFIRGYDWNFLHNDKEKYEAECREAGRKLDMRPTTLYDYFRENKVYAGEWHDWGLFEFKAFKKGTIHLKFKNDKDWEAINRAYAEIKGQSLPEKI